MLLLQNLTLTLIFLNFTIIYSFASSKCKDYCDDSTTISDPKQPINCFCSHCNEYDNCCEDKYSNQTKPSNPAHSECNIRINKLVYAYSIGKCGEWWSGSQELKNGCEKTDSKLFNNIPVYSNQTDLTYKNVYCARCNIKNFDAKRIIFFEVQTSTNELLEEEQLTELALLDLVSNQKSNEYSERTWIEFENPKENLNLRYCIKSIDSCPDGSSSEEKELCSGRTAYRYKFGKVYKNIDCAKCNGEKENEIMCANFEPRRYKSQSLQLLFDLSDLYGEIVINLNIKLKINENYVNSKRIECNRTSSDTLNQNLTSLNRIVCDNNLLNLTLNVNINVDAQCNSIEFENAEDGDNMSDWVKKYITICGQLISIISLILLLIMYFSNKVLRNLPGKLLICLSVSLLLSQILFLVSTYITKPYTHYALNSSSYDCNSKLNNNFENISVLLDSIFKSKSLDCYILGLLTHYFYLAFFTWSNIMAYDLYAMFLILSNKKLSKNTKAVACSNEDDNRKRFIRYLIIGWTFPLLVILVLLVNQYAFKYMAYSFNSCFISSQIDLLLFFILPVLIILLINIYYLVFSINSIRNVDKMSKKYLKHDYDEDNRNATTSMIVNVPSSIGSPSIQSVPSIKSKSKFIRFSDTIKTKMNKKNKDDMGSESTNDKKRLILFLKLFVLTGMTWIVGIFSSFMKTSFIWYVYIILNSLQGLFIFCAYAFNPQTKKHVSKTRFYKRLSSLFSTSESSSKTKLYSSEYRKSTSSSIEVKKI